MKTTSRHTTALRATLASFVLASAASATADVAANAPAAPTASKPAAQPGGAKRVAQAAPSAPAPVPAADGDAKAEPVRVAQGKPAMPVLPPPVSLERKVDILTDELQRMKEKLVIPEKDTLKSVYGLGPAASKIYRVERGFSMGGYGELFLDRKLKDRTDASGKKVSGADASGDALRYVQYVGFKFSDKLLVNAEIEVEHTGQIGLEFAYLDYLAHPALNLRAGLLLIPMGFINEIHEPVFFHGVLRPQIERVIIPATWRELGLGIFGEALPGLTYKLYFVSGFKAQGFTTGGWRGGRQNGNEILSNNYSVVGRLDYSRGDNFLVGASAYYGFADQDQIRLNGNAISASTFLVEGHVQARYKGFEFRGLGVYGTLSNAAELTQALFPSPAGGAPESRALASDVFGAYAEVAYDVWPLFSQKGLYLAPYFRYERFNTQLRVPTLPGRTADLSKDVSILEAGLTFKPHSQVAVKLSYRDSYTDAGAPVPDTLYLGLGFVY